MDPSTARLALAPAAATPALALRRRRSGSSSSSSSRRATAHHYHHNHLVLLMPPALLVLLLSIAAAAATASGPWGLCGRIKAGAGPASCTHVPAGFLLPPCSAAPRRGASTTSTSSSSSSRTRRAETVAVWGRKKKEPPRGLDREEDAEGEEKEEDLLSIIGGGKGSKGKGKAPRKKKEQPRPPVFTARIVLLGAPSPDWANGVRDRLLTEGWMPDRVQVLPLPDPQEYTEAKWIAYMREGIKLRNATFVIAGGPASEASSSSPAGAQVLRFLEKHPLRGAILIGPPDQYTLGGDKEPSRAWDFDAVRKHCPFVGLVYPRPGVDGEEEDDGWSPPLEAEAVREGLGLAPYPFGIRGPEPGQEYKAIEALIRDWQFLESLGMGPIQLVGEDEEEEAALAKALQEREGKHEE